MSAVADKLHRSFKNADLAALGPTLHNLTEPGRFSGTRTRDRATDASSCGNAVDIDAPKLADLNLSAVRDNDFRLLRLLLLLRIENLDLLRGMRDGG